MVSLRAFLCREQSFRQRLGLISTGLQQVRVRRPKHCIRWCPSSFRLRELLISTNRAQISWEALYKLRHSLRASKLWSSDKVVQECLLVRKRMNSVLAKVRLWTKALFWDLCKLRSTRHSRQYQERLKVLIVNQALSMRSKNKNR
jgi:hypothetical protein